MSVRFSVLASLVVFAASGCASPTEPLVLWDGYTLGWEDLNHRISYLRVGVAPGEGEGEVAAQLGFVGGTWTTGEVALDNAVYELNWREVASDRLMVAYGETTLTVGPEGVAAATEQVDLAELGLHRSDVVVVALQGIELDTDVPQSADFPEDYDPTDGWTPQRFGGGVGEATRDGDSLRFDVHLRFEPGLLDRPDMNEASPFATLGGAVRWAVIAVRRGTDAAWTPGAQEVHAYWAVDPPHTEFPPIDEADRTVALLGEPGLDQALPILQAWDIELSRTLEPRGRYLREFSAGIEAAEYEAPEATAELLLDVFCSISSIFEEGDVELDYTSSIGLLQLDDPALAVEPGTVSGMAPAGTFDTVVD